MEITAQITEEIDTQVWAELHDTSGMLASDVRKDIKVWMRGIMSKAVETEAKRLGLQQ